MNGQLPQKPDYDEKIQRFLGIMGRSEQCGHEQDEQIRLPGFV